MLQIKKNGLVTLCKFNLQFLFRNKKISDKYLAQKNVTQSITLRSPKHFNIGKYKIFNLNYQTPQARLTLKKKLKLQSFMNSDKLLFNIFYKYLTLTPTIFLKSIKITFTTKFKIKWLEI